MKSLGSRNTSIGQIDLFSEPSPGGVQLHAVLHDRAGRPHQWVQSPDGMTVQYGGGPSVVVANAFGPKNYPGKAPRPTFPADYIWMPA